MSTPADMELDMSRDDLERAEQLAELVRKSVTPDISRITDALNAAVLGYEKRMSEVAAAKVRMLDQMTAVDISKQVSAQRALDEILSTLGRTQVDAHLRLSEQVTQAVLQILA